MAAANPDIVNASVENEPQLRDLFLFTAGTRSFAVSADEVDGTAEAKSPTRLPNAPAAILGVVYARGRMLTVLDPIALSVGETAALPRILPAIISLRGDEQLALAADSVGETITVSAADIETAGDHHGTETNQAICGILRHGGETIVVLEPSGLFDAAVQRKDRRRRRF